MRLPKEELRAGIPIEDRKHEMSLLAPLAPTTSNIKRGCIPKNGSVEIHIRVFRETQSTGSYEIILGRHDGKDLITVNGELLHINTVEEICEYVTELCSGKSR
ncbi:hypothetical protein A2837_00100 [Candidatus Kaiserbacteria bacterium RIFCSPHIGHO2_01_FULL_46_22]|uniref:Uncharacterized protein n=1 Tax=Candidatus Kaiserbacteria bacterium RIFCSPHIGHO2_01_FULL_46_22 TaxID=1798475 RepID=A0A1F6C011_9BACT|nr:MAG: hypothetical protein A2837_00100 [Candidatus Kaiserbacteria bacterium RIFCSPHIGHO2_01_FULL_46_22]